ncbi:MAG: hypothetical protein ABI818_18680 [Acidobacteriota bacterium]
MKPDDPSDQDQPDQHSIEPPAKRPYVKPAFEHEHVFETMALSCGKITSTSAQCKSNRKNS